MSLMVSQIPSISIVYSTVCSDADQRKHQSSASLAFVRGTDRWPVNSPHEGPVTRKMFLFNGVIMELYNTVPVKSGWLYTANPDSPKNIIIVIIRITTLSRWLLYTDWCCWLLFRLPSTPLPSVVVWQQPLSFNSSPLCTKWHIFRCIFVNEKFVLWSEFHWICP